METSSCLSLPGLRLLTQGLINCGNRTPNSNLPRHLLDPANETSKSRSSAHISIRLARAAIANIAVIYSAQTSHAAKPCASDPHDTIPFVSKALSLRRLY
jgi:hypothetical protein